MPLSRARHTHPRSVRPVQRRVLPCPAQPSPRLQHRFGDYAIHPRRDSRLSSTPIQRALDDENVEEKAKLFLKCQKEEREMIQSLNEKLAKFSKKTSEESYRSFGGDLAKIRDEINKRHNTMAAVMKDYAETDDQGVRRTFFAEIHGKAQNDLEARFEKLSDQTVVGDEDHEPHKHRFLAHMFQSTLFETGRGRFDELMEHLGDRKINIFPVGLNGPQAGVADPDTDNPKIEKTDKRNKKKDKKLLEKVGGNLSKFVEGRRKLGDQRKANPKKSEVGDLQVNMDKYQKLFPIYYGHGENHDVQAYTSPMFTAIHHEVGHMVNALKGKSGRKADKFGGDEGPLSKLTDDEEIFNISLDKYSDKAFSDELHLPTRIAHGAIGGLSAMTDTMSHADLSGSITKWDELTYKRKYARRKALLEKIKTHTGLAWGPHTKWKSKPATVSSIGEDLANLPDSSKKMDQLLRAIKKKAATASGTKSKRRKEATKSFYALLAEMDLDSDEGLRAAHESLTEHAKTHFK